MNIQDVTFEQVEATYSGRHGCACGCRGNWWYSSNVKKLESYNTVNDRQVKRDLAKFKKNAHLVEFDDQYKEIFSFETENRLYILRLLEGK